MIENCPAHHLVYENLPIFCSSRGNEFRENIQELMAINLSKRETEERNHIV